MADMVDRAAEDSEILDDATINHIRQIAANIPKGEPGECVHCGEDFPRLVKGYCARCRDKLGRP